MAFRTDASAEMRTVADVFGKAAISAGIRMAQRCNAPGSWIEWHLALYRVLEEENIRFFCKDGQFELLDKEGHRIYFGVDHSEAAEQVLMKVLFPLNQ